jgi:hypothetical protein
MVEGIFPWYWLADLCVQKGLTCVLEHAQYMKATHGSKAKHDRLDVQQIAVLLRGGMLPQAYAYPATVGRLRDNVFLPRLFMLTLLLALLGGCSLSQGQSMNVTGKGPMVRLYIDLQEGFTDDTVIVKVNQEEVFNKHDVQTKLLLGYADTFEVEVPAGLTKVEIAVPTKKLSQTIELSVSKTTYLGVSIQVERIEHLVSETPFGYL